MVNTVQARLLVLILMLLASQAFGAANLGFVGKTYPIRERDALEELEGRVAGVDWKKKLSKIAPDKYRPDGLVDLPKTNRNNSRLVDMSYTLDMDVPDGKGGILYPRGYTFNPLDYVPFNKTIVVINPDDKDQLLWFLSSDYAKKIDVMLLITGGSFASTAKKINRPVFYADSRLISKFQLKAVPSVIRQSGRMMEVSEIYVQKKPR